MTEPAVRPHPSPRRAAALGAACLAARLAAAPAEQPAPPRPPAKRVSPAEFVKDPRKLASLRRGVTSRSSRYGESGSALSGAARRPPRR
jgi:hypothetical protein